MSSRIHKHRSKDPESYHWSTWETADGGQPFRWRTNSKGRRVYDYNYPSEPATEPNDIPRYDVSSTAVLASAGSTTAVDDKEDYEDGDFTHQSEVESSARIYRVADMSTRWRAFDPGSSVSRPSQGNGFREDPSGFQSGYNAGSSWQPDPVASDTLSGHNMYMDANASGSWDNTEASYTPQTRHNDQHDSSEDEVGNSGVNMSNMYCALPTVTVQRNTFGPIPNPSSSNSIVDENPYRYIKAAESLREEISYSRFKCRHSSEFKFGKVIKVLLSDLEGQSASYNNSNYDSVIGRFVIVATGEKQMECLPILTYDAQATTKRGVHPGDHAIIHTGHKTPAPLQDEIGLFLKPIRVEKKSSKSSSSRSEELRIESRLNYAKTCILKYNCEVQFIGKIHQNSMKRFQTGLDTVWAKHREQPPKSYTESEDTQQISRESYQQKPLQPSTMYQPSYQPYYQPVYQQKAQFPFGVDQPQLDEGKGYQNDDPVETLSGEEILHNSDEDTEEEGIEGRKPVRPSSPQKPQPPPRPDNCKGGVGCGAGAQHKPGDANPRPPPSGSSRSSGSHYRTRDTQSSNYRDSNSNSKRDAGPQEMVQITESNDVEQQTKGDVELDRWLAEYKTWKDVTCACGFGYYTIQGEWIAGVDVRAGRAPPKPEIQLSSILSLEGESPNAIVTF